jgi:tRNA pseudouridine38-40 synthase
MRTGGLSVGDRPLLFRSEPTQEHSVVGRGGDGMVARNVALRVAYQGTRYHGFQAQPGLPTIQGMLAEAVAKVFGRTVTVEGSGRTDAGVHARAQTVNFRLDHPIPTEKIPEVLNRALPEDIVVYAAREVPDSFHARRDAIAKVYVYQLDRSRYGDVFTRAFSYHYPHPLDMASMRRAAAHLTGRHDFTSFCAASTAVENKVRTIFSLTIREEGIHWRIVCRGEGFLHHMVRIIAGTLIDVGRGMISPASIPDILLAKDRTRAGMTAPACGLTLWDVEYPPGLVSWD